MRTVTNDRSSPSAPMALRSAERITRAGAPRGLHRVHCELFPVAITNRLQLARCVGDLPHQPELAGELAGFADVLADRHLERIYAQFLAAERLPVQEQFDLLRIGVDHHRDLLALVPGPVPVRENMDRRLRGPEALVAVKAVLREPGEIDYAEVGTARWPVVTAAVGSRLTKVVEAGPDEFAQQIRKPPAGYRIQRRGSRPRPVQGYRNC